MNEIIEGEIRDDIFNNLKNIISNKLLLVSLVCAFLLVLLFIPLVSANPTYIPGPNGIVASIDDYDGV